MCEVLPYEVGNNVIETLLKGNVYDNDLSCEVSLYMSDKTMLELNIVEFVKILRYHTDYSLKEAVDTLKILLAGSSVSVILRKEIYKVDSEFFKYGVEIYDF